ncbi:hypothetical protein ACWEN3_00780 [Streptomyces sp. NPDC004561]
MEGWKFWWGIAAFFLGGLATQFTGWLAYRRQRAERVEDAAAAAAQRRADFELEHLMATNQKLHDYRERFLEFSAAAMEVGSSADQEHAARNQVLEEANATLNVCEVALYAHIGFILDDVVRASVLRATQAIEAAATLAIGGGAVDYPAVNRAVSEAYDTLSARVRQFVRRQCEAMTCYVTAGGRTKLATTPTALGASIGTPSARSS